MNTLFDNDCRYMSDSELIYEISNNRQIVSDVERSNGEIDNEEFWVVAINNASRIIKKVQVSVGGIDQTSADVRLIMQVLINTGASQFAAVHNHPSGNSRPSNDDKRLTEQLKKAAGIFNIRMMDHVIITNDGYYSFCDEGMI